MSISLILPTHNRNELLRYGLSSILSQKFPDLEIIILNEGDDSVETKIIAHEAGAKYIYTNNKKWRVPGFALNIGVKQSTGEIIIISCPEIYHLGQSIFELSYINDNELGIPATAKDDNGTILKILQRGNNGSIQQDMTRLKPLNVKLPFLMSVHRSVFIDIGGYDEDFTGVAYEDNDFVDRLMSIGCKYKLVGCSCIHLYHPRGNSFRGTTNKDLMFNKMLYETRKGQNVRNQDREWGIL